MSNSEILVLPKRGRGRPTKAEQIERAALEARIARAQQANKAPELTPEKRLAEINSRFDAVRKLAATMIEHQFPRALILSGGPGVGKSHMLEAMMRAAESQHKIRYRIIRGSITGLLLYITMYNYRGPRDILLLDDSDDLYDDENGMNILKSGLDTSPKRMVNWLSTTSILTSKGIDTTFEYQGTMIFITNKDFQSIIETGKSKMVSHLRALDNRAIYIDLKLHDPYDIFLWTNEVAKKTKLLTLPEHRCSQAQHDMAAQWLRENWKDVRNLSIRTMVHLGKLIRSDERGWRETARIALLR